MNKYLKVVLIGIASFIGLVFSLAFIAVMIDELGGETKPQWPQMDVKAKEAYLKDWLDDMDNQYTYGESIKDAIKNQFKYPKTVEIDREDYLFINYSIENAGDGTILLGGTCTAANAFNVPVPHFWFVKLAITPESKTIVSATASPVN